MPPSEAQKRAAQKWAQENMTTLACKVRKEQADAFKEYAAAKGTTANNMIKEYVLRCISGEADKEEQSRNVWTNLSMDEMMRRQAEGIAEAKERGVYTVHHKGKTRKPVDPEAFEGAYKGFISKAMTIDEAAEITGLSVAQTRRRFHERRAAGDGYDPNKIPNSNK